MTITSVKHKKAYLMLSIQDEENPLKYPYVIAVLNVFKTRKEATSAVFKMNYAAAKKGSEKVGK